MKVLVCGASGCVGGSVVRALRSRGHLVVEGNRQASDAAGSMRVDYGEPLAPSIWAERLSSLKIDAVVNCVGILMADRRQSFERVHALGPVEMFRGAQAAGVRRLVQVSALGAGSDASASPYLRSKRVADDALAKLPIEWAVVRPSLVFGPRSQSGRLFATLASLPVIGLPGRGGQTVAPVHVLELAEAIVRLLEAPTAPNAVFEIGGDRAMSYREMLVTYRRALGFSQAIWLPVPMQAMHLGAWLAESVPQKVFSRDTLRLLERGSVPTVNALPALLGRMPSALAHGLVVSRPEPMLDIRVSLGAPVEFALRAALGFIWLYTAAISALLPNTSGVMTLLARCGLDDALGIAALVFSCTLNATLGGLTLLRPSPWSHACQVAAVIGYTFVAAVRMPELMLDHCGPLLKNLPVLMAALVLWLAQPRSKSQSPSQSQAQSQPNPVSQSRPRLQRRPMQPSLPRATSWSDEPGAFGQLGPTGALHAPR